MKKHLLLSASLIAFALSPLHAANLFWSDPETGNLNDAESWSTVTTPMADDSLYFDVTGNFSVNATGDLDIRSLETRTGSGIVTFNLGAYTLNASSTFVVNRDTVWEGGKATGNLQIANGLDGKSFTITGAGSEFTVVSAMVGRSSATASGNNNTWTVAGGAKLVATKNGIIIGNNFDDTTKSANGNSMIVTGAGTTVTSTGIIIGNLTTAGAGATANSNSMTVNDGAAVETTTLTIGRRAATGGSNAAATGNSITVGGTGAAATFTATAGVAVGPVGGNNVINVKQGGTFVAQGNTTLNNRAGNALNISGGTYNATGTTVLLYQSAALSLEDGGSFSAKTLDLRGTMTAKGSNTVTLETLISDTTTTYRFVLKGAQDYTKVNITGDMTFNGILNVTLDGGYAPVSGDSFQLFAFHDATGAFSAINLPTLAAGLAWDTTGLYQTGTIQVIPEGRTTAMQLIGLATLGFFWTWKKQTF